jgi:hypothetical protein
MCQDTFFYFFNFQDFWIIPKHSCLDWQIKCYPITKNAILSICTVIQGVKKCTKNTLDVNFWPTGPLEEKTCRISLEAKWNFASKRILHIFSINGPLGQKIDIRVSARITTTILKMTICQSDVQNWNTRRDACIDFLANESTWGENA